MPLVTEQMCGREDGLAHPGVNVVCWPFQTVAAVATALRQIEVVVETKTKDNVSIKVLIAVQYYVQPDKVDKYFYRLQQPERLIKSSIMDSVRSTLPAMTIEDAYVNKGGITLHAKSEAIKHLSQYGVVIDHVLCTAMAINNSVQKAMNHVVASRRLRMAATWIAEAQKIVQVKAAEAQALRQELQGVGVARQRHAIMEGMEKCVMELDVASQPPLGVGLDARDILVIVLMNDMIDMLKKFANSGASHLLVPTKMAASFDNIRNQVAKGAHVKRPKQITSVKPAASSSLPATAVAQKATASLPSFPTAPKPPGPLVPSGPPMPDDEAEAGARSTPSTPLRPELISVQTGLDQTAADGNFDLPGSIMSPSVAGKTQVGIDQIVEAGLQVLEGYSLYATEAAGGAASRSGESPRALPPWPGQSQGGSEEGAGVDTRPLTESLQLLNGMLGFVSPVPAPEEEEADVPLPRTENKME